MQQRNNKISIVKGIAIILMVIGHAEAPGLLMRFIYLFHMPLFFITAGYFFSKKYLDNPWDFCVKRFKGLYIPFLKWGIFFLLIHNLLFKFDILNEQYGNWENGVTHPYGVYEFCQRLVHLIFSMGGYDEFMAGAFWFFRALLVSSIVFLILYKLLNNRNKWLAGNNPVILICLACLLFAFFKIYYQLKIVTIVQGGIRETLGIFFFGLGVLYKSYENKIKEHWALFLLYIGLLIGGSLLKFNGMTLAMRLQDVVTLPITGFIGFLMVVYISGIIDRRESKLKRFLIYCGEMTVYIYVFHISAYKVISLIKIWWYDLDFKQIGCHMVIHDYPQDGFWILYSIAGVGIPLLWIWCYNKIFRKEKNKSQTVTPNMPV